MAVSRPTITTTASSSTSVTPTSCVPRRYLRFDCLLAIVGRSRLTVWNRAARSPIASFVPPAGKRYLPRRRRVELSHARPQAPTRDRPRTQTIRAHGPGTQRRFTVFGFPPNANRARAGLTSRGQAEPLRRSSRQHPRTWHDFTAAEYIGLFDQLQANTRSSCDAASGLSRPRCSVCLRASRAAPRCRFTGYRRSKGTPRVVFALTMGPCGHTSRPRDTQFCPGSSSSRLLQTGALPL